MSKPWESEGSIWETEAAFWTWLRGQLRRIWMRHPIKNAYLRDMSVPYKITHKNGNTKTVKGYDCVECGGLYKAKDVQVDHKLASGSFVCYADIENYVRQLLFVDFNDLQIMCKPCHKIKSHAERYNMSMEEARLVKRAIGMEKTLTTKQLRAWMEDDGLVYVPGDKLGNREKIIEHLRSREHERD